MPFKCKCGQTFERVDTFQGHTSACPRFHTPPVTIAPTNSAGGTPTPITRKNSISHGTGGTPTPSTRKNSISHSASIIINTASYSPGIGSGFPSPSPPSSPLSSPTSASLHPSSSPTFGSFNLHLSSSAPGSFDFVPVLLPTSLSIQSTFAGVRRRSSVTASSMAALDRGAPEGGGDGSGVVRL